MTVFVQPGKAHWFPDRANSRLVTGSRIFLRLLDATAQRYAVPPTTFVRNKSPSPLGEVTAQTSPLDPAAPARAGPRHAIKLYVWVHKGTPGHRGVVVP